MKYHATIGSSISALLIFDHWMIKQNILEISVHEELYLLQTDDFVFCI